jgi:hypothetical protein
MPWLIEMSVASLTLQRSVADCPRWMVDGSATNCAIEGLAGGGGGGVGSSLGGGGGGGVATFFLHPVAPMNSVNPNRIRLIFRLFIVDLASCRTINFTPTSVFISTPASCWCPEW